MYSLANFLHRADMFDAVLNRQCRTRARSTVRQLPNLGPGSVRELSQLVNLGQTEP
jgi:hypothetical protein